MNIWELLQKAVPNVAGQGVNGIDPNFDMGAADPNAGMPTDLEASELGAHSSAEGGGTPWDAMEKTASAPHGGGGGAAGLATSTASGALAGGPIGAGVGALMGVGNLLLNKSRADKENKMRTAEIALTPWTHMAPTTQVHRPNAGADIAGGVLGGFNQGQAVDQAAAREKLDQTYGEALKNYTDYLRNSPVAGAAQQAGGQKAPPPAQPAPRGRGTAMQGGSPWSFMA